MKIKTISCLVALAMGVSMVACNEDDDNVKVPDTFTEALNVAFPGATKVKWENNAGYRVAEFQQNGINSEAWYNKQVELEMTVRDYVADASVLPEPVSTALRASEYSTWTIDDIEYYERKADTFYVIEVEKVGQTDTDLYYSPDGNLIKATPETNLDILPSTKI